MIDNKYVRSDLKDFIPYEPSPIEEGIFLNANESPFNLPKHIYELFLKSLDNVNFNRYPDSDCRLLKESLAKFYKLDSANFALGVGSDDIIDTVFKSTLTKKKLLTLFPTFSMYGIYGKINNGEVIAVKGDENFNHSLESILKSIKENNPFAIVICNPNNPTGELLQREELIEIIESTDSLVIIDEAYSEFSNVTVSDLVDKYQNLVVLRTFSKAYSAASLRLGYAISNKSFIKMLESIKSPYRVNSMNLVLGSIILDNSICYSNNIKYIISETNRVYNELLTIKNLKVLPTKANFILFKCDKGLFDYLYSKHIIVRYFVLENEFYIRVSVGYKRENDIFIEEVKNYENLK